MKKQTSVRDLIESLQHWLFKYPEFDTTNDIRKYVDLGLPSGLKWATCNVGATSPEDYGNYYAWGETKTKRKYTKKNSRTYGKT